jgi:hypothetical protein
MIILSTFDVASASPSEARCRVPIDPPNSNRSATDSSYAAYAARGSSGVSAAIVELVSINLYVLTSPTSGRNSIVLRTSGTPTFEAA